MKSLKKQLSLGFAALGLFGSVFMFNATTAEAQSSYPPSFEDPNIICYEVYADHHGDCHYYQGTGCYWCDFK